MKKILFLFLIINFLNACQSVTEGFSLKKKDNADEFLVEKKNPLVLPPNFNKLPIPNETEIAEEDNESKNFEASLGKKNNLNQKKDETNNLSTTKEFILDKIKRNDSN